MNVRERTRRAEIDALAANPEPQRKAYSGAGSAFMRRIGRPLENTAGLTRRQIEEQKVRGEFAFEVDDKPRLEELAKLIAEDQAKVLANHRELSALICSKANLDALWKAEGHPDGCVLLREFERGSGDASPATATAFFQGPFKGFLNSHAFAKYRGTNVETQVCEIMLDWMKLQFIDELVAENWQKTLLLMDRAGYVLPEPHVTDITAPPDAIVYESGGKRYVNKAALDAMPSAEYRRCMEHSDFRKAAEVVLGGRLVPDNVPAHENRPDNTQIVLRNFPVTVGLSKRGEELRDLTMAQVEELRGDDYARAMTLLCNRIKTVEATQDSDGFVLTHLEARRLQWAR
jgi:hypothetical protein